MYVALAPMDGVTDWVHRQLATSLGEGDSGISLCVSEFVRVTDRAVSPKVVLRHAPELSTGGLTRSGVPVFVQLLGGDPEAMAASARVVASLGAAGIDLNFGCPAKRVNSHDGGAAILRCPDRLLGITRAVRDAVDPAVPVTVKIRLGWADADGVEALAEAAQRGGASWLTIHARTRTQMYQPPVDWAAIGRAQRAVDMPVVANGDLHSVQQVWACAEQSGCEAFMVGRGALSRPELFLELRERQLGSLTLARYAEVLIRYAELMLQSGVTDDGALRRLKQWLSLSNALRRAWLGPLFDELKVQRQLPAAVGLLEAIA